MGLNSIDTRILEVCERSECRKPLHCMWEVQGQKWGLTRLALESWKSAKGKNVSQASALNLGGSKKNSERVADRCFGTGKVPGQNMANLDWHQNPVRAQNVSQISALNFGGGGGVQGGLNRLAPVQMVRPCKLCGKFFKD